METHALALVTMTLLGGFGLPQTEKSDLRKEQARRLVGRWQEIPTPEKWWADLYFPKDVEFFDDGTYHVIQGPWSGMFWEILEPGKIEVRMMIQFVTYALRFEGDELILSLPNDPCSKRYRRVRSLGKGMGSDKMGSNLRELLTMEECWGAEAAVLVDELVQRARPWNAEVADLLRRLMEQESLWAPEARELLHQALAREDSWYEEIERLLENALGPRNTWSDRRKQRVELYWPLLIDDIITDEVKILWRRVLGGENQISKQIRMILRENDSDGEEA